MIHEKPVLILSEKLDYHGVAVRWGLKEMGVPFDWWERSEFPRNQLISTWVSPEHSRLIVAGSDVALSEYRYRTVWNRRGQLPQADEQLDRTDKIVARNESKFLISGLANMITNANPSALFVNAFEDAKTANLKVNQLNIARTVGFKIPSTVVSNNPEHIREFFNANNGKVIAKQHIPYAWRTKQGALLITGTAAVARECLNGDRALTASPMIYQEMLQIKSELRIIAFGRSVFAINQIRYKPASGSGFVDIRYEDTNKQMIVVPESLATLCFSYMEKAKLNFAAFDIAKTTGDEYIFLEANEAGQFLFLEDKIPDITILDAFCQFLSSGDPLFEYKNKISLRLAVFEQSDEAREFHARYEAHISKSEVTSPFELVEQY